MFRNIYPLKKKREETVDNRVKLFGRGGGEGEGKKEAHLGKFRVPSTSVL